MEKELKKEIEEIKIRNKRVEKDKEWETSYTRKICIAILTYMSCWGAAIWSCAG